MNSRSIFVAAALLLAGSLAAQTVSPVRLGALTCEHQQNPLGIGDTQPRLSWKLLSDRMGEVQTAYEIRAASTAEALAAGNADLWSSGKVASDQSVLVSWGGKPLASRSQAFWQVRVWDKDGQPSAWSDPASFELGL
jgi:alpha-L-rhamnosidase